MANKQEWKTWADADKIYLFRLPGEKEPEDLAMFVDLDYQDFPGVCFLTPPDRPHMIRGKPGRKTETGFTFIADKDAYEPGEWEFMELTYEYFKKEFYKYVPASDEILAQTHNTEELREWYHRWYEESD